jgi:acetyl-CoA C-acetyltransferase
VTSSLDPLTPVIVGAGQINDRELGSEPIDLMSRCTEAALTDSGAADGLRSRIDAVRVVWGVWPYRDPGRLVAERIGAPDARTSTTAEGGNQVYALVIDTAERIRNGEIDVAVICAAETLRTRRADRARGRDTPYLPEPEDAAPDDVVGSSSGFATPAEQAIGIDLIVRFYAMAETALRHRNGEDVETHRRRVAELWARASAVAAGNPHAWLRDRQTADDIASVSPRNRPIAAPYPKLMTSNLNVDQGGAIVMCSAAAADDARVPADRWVFPWAGVNADDPTYPTNRWALDESPGIRLNGRLIRELAGVAPDDCSLIDLYSCFPVAVQVAQRELGIPADRQFTITGGLTFAAGPLNCYCILPLTRSVELLREDASALAFLTGNGGAFSKHSALIAATSPPSGGFRSGSPQAEVDALPRRVAPDGPVAQATLETYTVVYDRDMQPERAILACLDEDGRRHWAESSDGTVISALLAEDCCERAVRLDGTTATFA